MNKKFGFIGAGNMSNAIIGGVLKSGLINKENILVSDKNTSKLEDIKSKYGVNYYENKELATKSDIIFLSIKPKDYKEAIQEVKNFLKNDVVLVTIIAGISIKKIKELFNQNIKVVRCMPNTPLFVGEGMTALACCENTSQDEAKFIFDIFSSLGKCQVVDEKLMDIITALSGSSPAFIYIVIESLICGAELMGMPRKLARIFASQTVLGSAKMVLETKKQTEELKNMVCSPDGTTLEGVKKLEQMKIKDILIDALKASYEKSKNISENFENND